MVKFSPNWQYGGKSPNL